MVIKLSTRVLTIDQPVDHTNQVLEAPAPIGNSQQRRAQLHIRMTIFAEDVAWHLRRWIRNSEHVQKVQTHQKVDPSNFQSLLRLFGVSSPAFSPTGCFLVRGMEY